MALCRTCDTVIPCHCHLAPPTQTRPGVYLTAKEETTVNPSTEAIDRLARTLQEQATAEGRPPAPLSDYRIKAHIELEQHDDDHEPGCASQSYPDPGMCFCADRSAVTPTDKEA